MTHLITGNKFDPNTDVPDLTDRVFVVTGGSAGIGYGIVAHLLQHNAGKIYMISNKEQHADQALEDLKKYGDPSRVKWVKCDLEDLKFVDKVAKELSSKLDRLDALVCNAGIGIGVYNETKDGIDSHMQVNHISQFHLVMTLLPVLQKTPNSRIVFQSSSLHQGARSVTFNSIEEINQDIGATQLYNRSKIAQIMFVRALARRVQNGDLGFKKNSETGPWINAINPGGNKTDQQDQAEEAYGLIGKIGVTAMTPFLGNAFEEGCRPALFAATSEDIVKDKVQGQYIEPDRKVSEPSSMAKDDEVGESLWKLTEQILLQKLGSLPYKTQYVD